MLLRLLGGRQGPLQCCWGLAPRALAFSSRPPTYYDDLGVHPQASGREIKTAFYSLSKQHHPDRTADDPEALARFHAISEAYDVLGTPATRSKYDKGVLGRSSSVAEREQASHRFEGEAFYEAKRGHMGETSGGKKLDKWVADNRTFDFQEKLSKKKRATSVESKRAAYSARQSNARTDSKGFSYIAYLLLALIGLKLLFKLF